MAPEQHIPVLLEPAVSLLVAKPAGFYVDCTVGLGGHAERILESGGGLSRLLGIDSDPGALELASRRLQRYGDRVDLVEGNFSDVKALLSGASCDGFLLDLGVSSYQIADRGRGFSFMQDGPLDMAMGRGARSVARLLGRGGEREIGDVIRRFGEERRHRAIAASIVRARETGAMERSSQLRRAIERAVPADHATASLARVFQALRIWANDELENLRSFLPEAVGLLREGGRIVVISYHSLEDRIVKQFFRDEEKGCTCPPDFPECACGREPTLRVLTRRPIRPGPEEIERNVRSRSARLRAVERLYHAGEHR